MPDWSPLEGEQLHKNIKWILNTAEQLDLHDVDPDWKQLDGEKKQLGSQQAEAEAL
jgi:hypothetical protein